MSPHHCADQISAIARRIELALILIVVLPLTLSLIALLSITLFN